MTNDCPYCGETKTNVSNHIRMASGDGHGESGEMPDDYGEDESEESDETATDSGADSDQTEVTTVGPEDFEDESEDAKDASNDADSGGENLPFDPSDDDVIALDGGEQLTVVAPDGSMTEATANDGDYLLVDEGAGQVLLYDSDKDAYFEVKTA